MNLNIQHTKKYIENSKALFLKLLILREQRLILQYSESVCVYFIKFYKNISLQFTIHAVDCQPCFVANIVITNQYKYWHNLRISLMLHHSTIVSPAPCCSITSWWGLELLELVALLLAPVLALVIETGSLVLKHGSKWIYFLVVFIKI